MPAVTKHQATAEALEQGTSGYAWYALGLLTLVYVLNFLDRTMIYILFTPIKKEMAFSDLQLALLGTTSFVIFYTALGIPFGRLSGSRRPQEHDRGRLGSMEHLLRPHRIRRQFLVAVLMSRNGRCRRGDAGPCGVVTLE
jgi:MFS family permease